MLEHRAWHSTRGGQTDRRNHRIHMRRSDNTPIPLEQAGLIRNSFDGLKKGQQIVVRHVEQNAQQFAIAPTDDHRTDAPGDPGDAVAPRTRVRSRTRRPPEIHPIREHRPARKSRTPSWTVFSRSTKKHPRHGDSGAVVNRRYRVAVAPSTSSALRSCASVGRSTSAVP